MDFGFTEEQQKFKNDIRSFLTKNVPVEVQEEWWSAGGLGVGPHSREFLRLLGKKGLMGIDWPTEYSGGGKTIIERFILLEELGYCRGPWLGVGETIAGPMILKLGSEQQKSSYIPKITRGEIEFTLGYTEPEAGSDLASLQIRAVEQDDHYIVNGQKMFNSTAHYADYHWLGARTDPDVPKHKGISLFIVDLKSHGITIEPIRIMSGLRTNFVYYDDVRVPKENMVGQKNRGFYHILEALDWERIYATGDMLRTLEELIQYAKEETFDGKSLASNPLIWSRLAEVAVELEAARLLALRVICLLGTGIAPPTEASMSKLFGDELRKRLSDIGMQVLGQYGQLQKDSKWAKLRGHIETFYRASPYLTLSAGTSEIQRNIIAQRGLGMPRQ